MWKTYLFEYIFRHKLYKEQNYTLTKCFVSAGVVNACQGMQEIKSWSHLEHPNMLVNSLFPDKGVSQRETDSSENVFERFLSIKLLLWIEQCYY